MVVVEVSGCIYCDRNRTSQLIVSQTSYVFTHCEEYIAGVSGVSALGGSINTHPHSQLMKGVGELVQPASLPSPQSTPSITQISVDLLIINELIY